MGSLKRLLPEVSAFQVIAHDSPGLHDYDDECDDWR